MGKDELISKLSTFIRNENFAKIDEIIKKYREYANTQVRKLTSDEIQKYMSER